MIRQYHARLVERADEAALSGNAFVALASMRRDAAIWALPALLAVAICWFSAFRHVERLGIASPCRREHHRMLRLCWGDLLSGNDATVSSPLTPQ